MQKPITKNNRKRFSGFLTIAAFCRSARRGDRPGKLLQMAANEKIAIAFFIPDLRLGGAERQLAVLVENLDKSRFAPIVIAL